MASGGSATSSVGRASGTGGGGGVDRRRGRLGGGARFLGVELVGFQRRAGWRCLSGTPARRVRKGDWRNESGAPPRPLRRRLFPRDGGCEATGAGEAGGGPWG